MCSSDLISLRQAQATLKSIGLQIASISYTPSLNTTAILAAAQGTGVDAIHPGYGFLAENATFAKLCRDNGIVFIGPTPTVIESALDALLFSLEAGYSGIGCKYADSPGFLHLGSWTYG